MINAVPYKNSQNSQSDNQDASEEPPTKRPGCFRDVQMYFVEFCDDTSIHGFRFLGEKKRTLVERVWWFTVITLCFSGCVYVILQTYYKWVSSPVIVAFATRQTSIGDIPFPAITICPDVVARRELFNYSDIQQKIETGRKITKEEKQGYNFMNMICEKGADLDDPSTRISDTTALDFIVRVSPSVNDTVKYIKWKGNWHEETEQLLTPTLTSEGVCFTFNILDRNDLFSSEVVHYKNFFSNGNISTWTIEDGYGRSSGEEYPLYSLISGMDGGIDFVLYACTADIDYGCSHDFIGFKATLQHPGLIPKGKKNFISIPLDQMVFTSAKPIMMETSEEVRNYIPHKRQCYFMSEKNLRFYKYYSQWNCLMECLTNATLQSCGCVAFYMTRDNSTLMCGPGSRQCMEKTKTSYLTSDFQISGSSKPAKKSFKDQCDCLPSCTSLDFEVEVSQSNWNWQRVYPNLSAGAHYSRFRVVFKDMQFITSMRNELYGMVDFLGNCGGLLGLFMGFSFISLFEIIYFLSLRLLCNIRRYGRRYWTGLEEPSEGR